jgi:hypothetical protein
MIEPNPAAKAGKWPSIGHVIEFCQYHNGFLI